MYVKLPLLEGKQYSKFGGVL